MIKVGTAIRTLDLLLLFFGTPSITEDNLRKNDIDSVIHIVIKNMCCRNNH